MKTSFVLLLCLPLVSAAAPNRFGASAAPGTGTPSIDCPNAGTCSNVGTGWGGGRGFGRGQGLGTGNGVGAGSCLGVGNGAGCAQGGPGSCALSLPAGTKTTLTASQLNAAIEEERVAHDLYVLAADKWQLAVFRQIASAETRHAAALTRLGTASSMTAPVAVAGTYITADLQSMYASLRPLMIESETGALRAGAFVEESDIAGLRRLLAGHLDDATKAILANLERASRFHLRAYVRNLATRGVTYVPQVLSAADYAAIVG